MRLNLELDAFLILLGQMASDAKDAARIEFPGAKADAVTVGIAFLYEHIRKALAATAEYDLSPESEVQVLHDAISKHCLTFCDGSKENGPGGHERCAMCHLMPYTVEAVENVVGRVMEDDG